MMITVDTPMGQRLMITSKDPVIIGAWFKELIPELLSNNASMPPYELTIRPMDREEAGLVGREFRNRIGPSTHTEWRDLGILFLGIAGKVLDNG